MGKVFRSKDAARDRRRMMEEAMKDLSPGMRDAALRILELWRGVESEEQLRRLLGKKGASHLLRKIGELQKSD